MALQAKPMASLRLGRSPTSQKVALRQIALGVGEIRTGLRQVGRGHGELVGEVRRVDPTHQLPLRHPVSLARVELHDAPCDPAGEVHLLGLDHADHAQLRGIRSGPEEAAADQVEPGQEHDDHGGDGETALHAGRSTRGHVGRASCMGPRA